MHGDVSPTLVHEEAAMESRERRDQSNRLSIPGLALMFLVFYFASAGPVAMFVKRAKTGGQVAGFVYAPLIWLHDKTPLEKPLDWYLALWELS
jgi:hypothetical protein